MTSLVPIIVTSDDLIDFSTYVAFSIHDRNGMMFHFPRNALTRLGIAVLSIYLFFTSGVQCFFKSFVPAL